MHSSRSRRVLTASTLTATLVGVLGPATAGTSRFGHVGAADRLLRPGCHHYRYHYVVEPPSDDWLLET
jgi:hypothetical protein